MKFNHQCPKCQSHNIVKEDRKSNPYYTNFVYVKKNWSSYINLARYICLHCGFTEEWVDNNDELEKIEKKLKDKNDRYDGFV